ncbi:MAG: hypothetical protein JWP01_533 [Myxococcales bacterium]|nr:hypothetical protein [Myxococcales bacterium]
MIAIVLGGAPTGAEASPNTDRIISNVGMSLDNITIVEAYATAVPEKERQTATNLLRDIDYALRRANGDLGRVPPAEQDADVKALMKRVADLTAYRDKLAKNLEASVKGGAELDGKYRAFREDSKPYRKAVQVFTLRTGSVQQFDSINAAVITEVLSQLTKLDEICTTKYKGLEANDKLAFQLAVDPAVDCSIASRRLEIATTLVEGSAANDVATRVKNLDKARTGLEAANGFLSELFISEMVFDPEKALAAVLAKHQPNFKAIGKTAPADLVVPISKAVTALWVEVDRLAPTYEFPSKLQHDAAAEAGAKKAVAKVFDGAKVVKSGMQFGQWSVAKNNLDIPTEQYRTGTVLFKAKTSKWCQQRDFTAHKTYIGGGKYQKEMTFTFGGQRYQKCK